MSCLFKRLTALLLCLCLLLPAFAVADDAHAVHFTLQAEMFPENYPKQDQALMQGLSELVNMIGIEGVFQMNEDSFDLDADLLLDKDEKTRTDVRLYGFDSHWGIQSSLFGEEELSFNLTALLEFCMKAYFHLEVPLQRVGLFLTPYVHTDGLSALTALWSQVMDVQEGSRTIARDDVLAMARRISKTAESDRAFTYWVQAIALEAGYDGAINDFMGMLSEWLDSFMGEEGIVITVDDEHETWSTGDLTLFSRTVDDGWSTISLSLPETLDGYLVSGFCTIHDNGSTLYADVRLTVTQDEESILDLRLAADNIPLMIDASGDFALTWDMTGDAVLGGFHFLAEGSNDNGAFIIHQKDAVTGQVMLTLSGTAEAVPVTSPLNWRMNDLTGLEFFSVNDVSLSQFIKSVQSPLIKGMLPLLARAPMAACQSLLDLATEAGIFDVFTSSASSVDETDESSFDEESWDEESWDEESWDEESWDEESWDEESWDDSMYE